MNTRERQLTYHIQEDICPPGSTVGQFLRSQGYSAKVIVKLRQTPDGILADGQPVRTIHRLQGGEVLTVTVRESSSSAKIVPTPMDLRIVYEDEDLLVINKAAGIPIHPSQGHFSNTLANGLAWYFQQRGEPFVYRVINRLDRDTSGLLIVAKHMLSACLLSHMGSSREIHREYLAIAAGKVPEQGVIDAPIVREEGSVIARCVDPARGEDARTHYERILYNPAIDASLVKLCLETGRTHQIRVHMKHIGHPLPGDFLYNPDFSMIGRQALHSCRLGFRHPITKKELLFEAPLPDDMKFIYTGLRSPLG